MSLILLVEGTDDRHVTQHVLLTHDEVLTETEKVQSCQGFPNLLENILPPTLNASSYRGIGVIVDADLDVGARWEALRYRLKEAGYVVPVTPDPAGTIITGARTVGVWLMPDNAVPGSVEDFVERLIPSDDPLWPLARNAVASIPQSHRRFSTSSMLKAELHTYLAWQEEPGTPYGAAIAKHYFESGGVTANAFVAWFKRLRTLAAS